jgi:hypothetical protein
MTFIVKTRGDSSRLIEHEYLCDQHGRFSQLVPQADAPDSVPCPVEVDCDHQGTSHACVCGLPSPWSPSSAPAVHTQFVVSATQGKSAAKPHETALDTRPLGEGQKFHDWKKDRAKIWEEKRKRRVMELLK